MFLPSCWRLPITHLPQSPPIFTIQLLFPLPLSCLLLFLFSRLLPFFQSWSRSVVVCLLSCPFHLFCYGVCANRCNWEKAKLSEWRRECGVTCLVTLPHVFVNKAVSIDQPVVMWTIQSTPNPHDWRLEKNGRHVQKGQLRVQLHFWKFLCMTSLCQINHQHPF